MFWTVEKLDRRLQELAGLRYREEIRLEEWGRQEDEDKANGVQRAPKLNEPAPFRIGDRWDGRDRYVWAQRAVRVPAQWQGRTVVGLFDFGKTGGGHNSGFESLLYLNGVPYQGVDSNHPEVFLPDDAAGSELEFTFRLWSGLEGGGEQTPQEHKFNRASLAWLDAAADNLYYAGRAALHTSNLLADSDPLKQSLLVAVDRAFKLIDWAKPGSDAFYASVAAADEELAAQLAALPKHHPVTVTAIGHTHIDVAWLWRLTHTREKAARSFTTVLRLMERYPEYVFLQTMPQLYDYIKDDYPEIYEQMKARIAEGRWEAGGAMWLEADCNLVSGESLVRQLLQGTRFFREEFGVECDYLWLPDVFGYSWALPQILKKSGIKTFMTTKISWNQYNRMPHDTFNWRGIDGTEMLTHFVTTPEIPGSTVWWYTYNGLIEPFAVKGIWDTYRDKNVNQELLLSYGYGDGGGGVNRDMLEMRRRLNDMPGLPNVVTGRAGDYFAKLRETVASTDQYVHTWDGELYLEYHRGTYTSQAYNKRMNRKLELLYRDAEWLQSLAAASQGSFADYPHKALNEGWKIILRNQFHDIIPGSSIPEVYEDSRVEYAEAERIGLAAVEGAAGTLRGEAGEPGAWTVYNSASFDRTELVSIAGEPAEGVWTDDQGRTLQAEYAEGEWRVRVEGVPSMGSRTIRFDAAQAAEPSRAASPFSYREGGIRTPFYKIEWNAQGQLTRIYDVEAGREVLANGERGNVLQVFEDKPKDFEAWDVDLFYQEKMREIADLKSVRLVRAGVAEAAVRFEWTYMDSTVVQTVRVYADSRRIDFETNVDWQERQQLLKVAFPVSVRSTEATYDIQYGNVKRPTHWNTSWDYARFESVGHQWVDLSERGYGVSLLNDCKYGHDIKDHTIRLSLIKSAKYPDPTADAGEHVFTYSLLPHRGDWVAGNTVREAWALNSPMLAIAGSAPQSGRSLFKADRDNVFIDAAKRAEDGDGVVVRLHEFTGARGSVRLLSDFAVASWQECDLMERPIGETVTGLPIELNVSPYEIKTVLVTFEA
ncbi:alpha-mannosidase [Cohnella sp. GCM10027633]|uniref:alpha-mannosidase n=1 Tax=unclassified Cohnella TaxID=2636738 RepID=UPI00362A194E